MDLISMLVNVAGTESFISEYTIVLAERFLKSKNYETIAEVEQIEFLKMKFGEQLLHKAEVMLKDISDSKRINENIYQKIMVWRIEGKGGREGVQQKQGEGKDRGSKREGYER
jgi:hypothetical protein